MELAVIVQRRRVLKPDAIPAWLNSPVGLLEGDTPLDGRRRPTSIAATLELDATRLKPSRLVEQVSSANTSSTTGPRDHPNQTYTT